MDKQIQIFLAAAGQRWHPGLLLLSRSSTKVYESRLIHDWLVVLTILKHISQWDYPIYYGKNMFETTNQMMPMLYHMPHKTQANLEVDLPPVVVLFESTKFHD